MSDHYARTRGRQLSGSYPARHLYGAHPGRKAPTPGHHRRTLVWCSVGVVIGLLMLAPELLGNLLGTLIVVAVVGGPVLALVRAVRRSVLRERAIIRQRAEAQRLARAQRIDELERELGIGWYGLGAHPAVTRTPPDV